MADIETLEETRRRLGLSSGPGTAPRVARQRRRAPIPTPGGLRRAVAIGVIATAGLVALGEMNSSPRAAQSSVEWGDYPGTYFEDSDVVLANDSLEATAEKGDALLAELQRELSDYGFTWTTEYASQAYHPDNGYHGQSMLYNYESASIIGAAPATDPAARQNIIRIFDEVLSARGALSIWVENDTAEGIDAAQRFGSELRDSQALWSAWSPTEHFAQLQGYFSVFDATVPTAEEFAGDYWVPYDSTGTLFVRLSVGANYLLSDDDRASFAAALEPYAGQPKADYGS
jgi:hypothetical protein